MERELVPNNTTLASLRGLLREARKNVAPEEAIYVGLRMWHYDEPPTGSGAIREAIEVYRSGTGKATHSFKSIKEARAFIDSWKEESNATTP